jgi:hypothetical protein
VKGHVGRWYLVALVDQAAAGEAPGGPFIAFVKTVGLVGLLGAALWASYKRVFVWAWQYDEAVRERDAARLECAQWRTHVLERQQALELEYDGPERRTGTERRTGQERRRGRRQVAATDD